MGSPKSSPFSAGSSPKRSFKLKLSTWWNSDLKSCKSACSPKAQRKLVPPIIFSPCSVSLEVGLSTTSSPGSAQCDNFLLYPLGSPATGFTFRVGIFPWYFSRLVCWHPTRFSHSWSKMPLTAWTKTGKGILISSVQITLTSNGVLCIAEEKTLHYDAGVPLEVEERASKTPKKLLESWSDEWPNGREISVVGIGIGITKSKYRIPTFHFITSVLISLLWLVEKKGTTDSNSFCHHRRFSLPEPKLARIWFPLPSGRIWAMAHAFHTFKAPSEPQVEAIFEEMCETTT